MTWRATSARPYNVEAMLSGSLTVSRKPMVQGLACTDVAAVLARPFTSPFQGATTGQSAELLRRLAARRVFVPWGKTGNITPSLGARPLQLGGLPLPLKPADAEPELPEVGPDTASPLQPRICRPPQLCCVPETFKV